MAEKALILTAVKSVSSHGRAEKEKGGSRVEDAKSFGGDEAIDGENNGIG